MSFILILPKYSFNDFLNYILSHLLYNSPFKVLINLLQLVNLIISFIKYYFYSEIDYLLKTNIHIPNAPQLVPKKVSYLSKIVVFLVYKKISNYSNK